jgi:hypothetical protein
MTPSAAVLYACVHCFCEACTCCIEITVRLLLWRSALSCACQPLLACLQVPLPHQLCSAVARRAAPSGSRRLQPYASVPGNTNRCVGCALASSKHVRMHFACTRDALVVACICHCRHTLASAAANHDGWSPVTSAGSAQLQPCMTSCCCRCCCCCARLYQCHLLHRGVRCGHVLRMEPPRHQLRVMRAGEASRGRQPGSRSTTPTAEQQQQLGHSRLRQSHDRGQLPGAASCAACSLALMGLV